MFAVGLVSDALVAPPEPWSYHLGHTAGFVLPHLNMDVVRLCIPIDSAIARKRSINESDYAPSREQSLMNGTIRAGDHL